MCSKHYGFYCIYCCVCSVIHSLQLLLTFLWRWRLYMDIFGFGQKIWSRNNSILPFLVLSPSQCYKLKKGPMESAEIVFFVILSTFFRTPSHMSHTYGKPIARVISSARWRYPGVPVLFLFLLRVVVIHVPTSRGGSLVMRCLGDIHNPQRITYWQEPQWTIDAPKG